MNLFTSVNQQKLNPGISLHDTITVLGSCFADNIGTRLIEGGFNVSVNPFGTLYNPASISEAIDRLNSCRPFNDADCVQMGAGADLICSHSHHTSFARMDAAGFLANANASLDAASSFWHRSNKVIITLGTAFVWRLLSSGAIVANCLKRPQNLFSHEMLGIEQCALLLSKMMSDNPDKSFIFTVSPIRHLAQGAHENTLSKATLHLAIEKAGGQYFPAYEILMDELRDYRFYSDDLTHPSECAVEIIWERFLESAVPKEEFEQIRLNRKESIRKKHRPIIHI